MGAKYMLLLFVVLSSIEASEGSQSSSSHLRSRRHLFDIEGSDCLRSGGGIVPYFNSCIGCPIGSAQQCVVDMRTNASFNVQASCALGKVGGSDESCCAVEGKRETYAYRDAFRCLKKVHKSCVDTHIYAELKKECDAACARESWDKACLPTTFDSASSQFSPRPLRLSLVAIVILVSTRVW